MAEPQKASSPPIPKTIQESGKAQSAGIERISKLCYWLLGIILVLALAGRSHAIYDAVNPQSTAIHHAKFQARFCPVYTVHDLTQEDPPEIHISLSEECYGDRWKLPPGVYAVQKSQNPGDYASFWCNDHANPTRIVEYTEDGMAETLADGCGGRGDVGSNFRAQGHGEIVLTRTVDRAKQPSWLQKLN